ncbi:beta-propeller domain-containing protein [Actinomadura sp. WMMA1423]|uniref:beta-propeller domain-containing protein n=1 Tax=Actinomadura sp. WMMA1423 TaxID=2591108 RepID=UPI001146873C|nr:beta-propeller domain-containing protein [Actinomadura sp. WMMA1423]
MRGRIFVPVATTVLLAVTAGCTPSGEAPGRTIPERPPVRLVAYDDCEALHDELRRATLDKVGPYGLSRPPDDVAALGKAPMASGESGSAPEHSTTNSHEPGADEPDQVKTDGRRIVAFAQGRLRVIDPASRKVTHTLRMPDGTRYDSGELLLSGDRALVLTRQTRAVASAGPEPGAAKPGQPMQIMRLTLVDLSGKPKVAGTMTSGADYLDARQTGSVVRVVVRSEPSIYFPGEEGLKKATEANRGAVLKAPLEAWLPSFEVEGGQTYRTPCDQVSRPSSYAGSSMLTLLTFDLSKGLGDPLPVAVAADGSTVYGNGKSLYVTGTPPELLAGPREKVAEPRTDVFKFDLGGAGRPRYAASGSVKGFLLNQYSMSEHEGNLRLAATTGRLEPGGRASQSSVYVLARHGSRLDQIGRLDGLGKGERIYSVRFVGATGYVVTFRQTDPLYVVDLKDPRRPRSTGELKINGYSAYLHPTADGKLLGVGQDADPSGRTGGLQVSLFDVSGEPRRIGAYRLPGSNSQAEFDAHAFLYWPKTGLTVVPVAQRDGGAPRALGLKVTGSEITEVGTVRHPGERYGGGVSRSLVIGGTLWTFSDEGAHAADASTLKGGDWLPYD